jgi:hypothetical protein
MTLYQEIEEGVGLLFKSLDSKYWQSDTQVSCDLVSNYMKLYLIFNTYHVML